MHLQAVGALYRSFGSGRGDGVPFAEWTSELLYMARLSPSGAEPKRKRVLNERGLVIWSTTRNLSDLHMARLKGV